MHPNFIVFILALREPFIPIGIRNFHMPEPGNLISVGLFQEGGYLVRDIDPAGAIGGIPYRERVIVLIAPFIPDRIDIGFSGCLLSYFLFIRSASGSYVSRTGMTSAFATGGSGQAP